MLIVDFSVGAINLPQSPAQMLEHKDLAEDRPI